MEISQHHEDQIKRKVESGKYGSPDEVIGKALEVLDEREEALAQELEDVRAKVQEGTDQLARGEYVEYTDETLNQFFDELEAEAFKDLETQPHTGPV